PSPPVRKRKHERGRSAISPWRQAAERDAALARRSRKTFSGHHAGHHRYSSKTYFAFTARGEIGNSNARESKDECQNSNSNVNSRASSSRQARRRLQMAAHPCRPTWPRTAWE